MAHTDVHLTYSPTSEDVKSDPEVIKIAVGDTLAFHSSQGPVNILFQTPGIFSAEKYSTGHPPVKVKKAAHGKFCCGVVIQGAVVGYPEHERFGKQVIPDGSEVPPPPPPPDGTA